MTVAIITKEDFHEFKMEILEEIKKLKNSDEKNYIKNWLKSNEVRKMLNISPGTLQNLRINGTLSYTKIGGTIYYANADIEKVLQLNKVEAFPTLFK